MNLTVMLFLVLGWGVDAAHAAKAKAKLVAKPVVQTAPKTAAKTFAVQRAQTPKRNSAQTKAPARRIATASHSVPSQKPVPQGEVEASGLTNSLQGLRGSSNAPMTSLGRGGTHEIGEAMRVTGQSRNLSMGLLFSKDGDKIEFGSPRMHYKDKITSSSANY
jgi:hypothetical protein